jgi:hypothetical protein
MGISETWDLAGAGRMLVGTFGGGLNVWFRPKVIRFEYLLDAEDEQVVRRLRTKGHELHWALETRLRQLQRDGWKPQDRTAVNFYGSSRRDYFVAQASRQHEE